MVKNNKFKTIFMALLLLIISNLTIAGTVEKLAEYSAFEILADLSSGGSATYLNGHPYLIKLENNDGKTSLVTTTLINNYSDVVHYDFSLEGIVAANANYEIDAASNSEELFVLLTNDEDSVRKNKNLLLKSTDGKTWKLFKTFPSEWSLDTLEIVGDNISVHCSNCEDTYKDTPVISIDSGKSWQKYPLPESVSYSLYSGIANNRLFAMTESRDAQNRDLVTLELQYKDLKAANSSWVKANIKNLLQIPTPADDGFLHLVEVTEIFDIADYLVANVTYETSSEDYKYVAWISSDNGANWEFLNFNLNDGYIMQLAKQNNNYHLVTSKKPSFDASWDPEEQDFVLNLPKSYKNISLSHKQDPVNILEAILSYFADQKYSYYAISQEEILNNSKASLTLSPKFEFPGAVGLNLNYVSNPKTTYVDTMLVRNNQGSLNLEFYRLRD